MSKYGKTSVTSGEIYDADRFKKEAFADYAACNFEKALLNFSKCLSENNKDEEAWIFQIMSQIHLDKYAEALTWAKKAYDFFNASSELQSLLALALALGGNAKEGLAYSDGAVAKNAPAYFVWYARGEIIANAGNMNTALVCFKKAVELKKAGLMNADFEIGMAFLRARKYPAALPYFKKAAQSGMSNYFVFEKIGLINENLGFLDEAEFYYKLSFDNNMSYKPASEGIARVHSRNTFFYKILKKICDIFKIGGPDNGSKA